MKKSLKESRVGSLIFFALIKFSAVVGDARGKQGGLVFSRNSAGAYVRAKVTPVNPRTALQSAARGLFASISTAWKSLSQGQKQSFIDNAPLYVRNNVFGDSAPLTGKQLYQKLNQNMQLTFGSGLSICIPPVTVYAVAGTELELDKSASTVTALDIPDTTTTDGLLLYATAPLSSGTKFIGPSQYRLVKAIGISQTNGNIDITTDYASVFGINPNDMAVGSVVGYKIVRVSKLNGQRSAETEKPTTVFA